MTKPMPTGTYENKVPSWREFNSLLEAVDLNDSIGNVFVVDTFFIIKTQPKNKRYTMKYFCP